MLFGFDAGWELDLFGKYRREMEAAEYDTEAAIAARNAVLISVIADVARAYVDMRALQMQLAVLEKNTRVALDYFNLTQERFDRGITNELDLTLAQRQLASLEAEKMPLIHKFVQRNMSSPFYLDNFRKIYPKNLKNRAWFHNCRKNRCRLTARPVAPPPRH